ncbi:hypothetical protein KSP39_PZI021301 [Platanthera zijinensis]|uniref:Transmembrane protein n=1 Tax=Platanthera zijinensis TaxID=2320716 RepID=A0AAP0AYN1_9ASPA
MAQTALALSASLVFSVQPCVSFMLSSSPAILTRNRRKFEIHAKSGGRDGKTESPEKKFITREEEPKQYWQTAGEREGENPMKTPLPYIIIFGMSTPFVILAIAFVNGWIKVPIR